MARVGGGGPTPGVIVLPLTGIRTVLCIGAHCDDIEIGCGGTLLRLVEANAPLHVHWMVFSSDEVREREARAAAAALLADVGDTHVVIESFRERYFPYVATEIKETFDRLGSQVAPDLVFTHARDDLHQDHRLLSELTYNTFRDSLVLEYEIPKIDGDLGRPNVFVHLQDHHGERKISTLLDVYGSQADKHWFRAETFWATLHLRGMESRAPSGLAEGFHCRKVVLG